MATKHFCGPGANVRQRLKKGGLPNFGQRVKIVGQNLGPDFIAGDQISNYQHNWTQTTSFSFKLSGFCSSAPFCSAVEVNWVQFRWIGLRLNEWLSINCLGDYKQFQNAFHAYYFSFRAVFWTFGVVIWSADVCSGRRRYVLLHHKNWHTTRILRRGIIIISLICVIHVLRWDWLLWTN